MWLLLLGLPRPAQAQAHFAVMQWEALAQSGWGRLGAREAQALSALCSLSLSPSAPSSPVQESGLRARPLIGRGWEDG